MSVYLDPSEYATPPPDYITPSWPALYLPWRPPTVLYYPSSIWRFTVYWMLIFHLAIFGFTAIYAVAVFVRQRHKRRRLPFIVGIPAVIVALQGIIAFLAGTVIGFALAALYVAAYLRMSTWVPFLWAFAHVLTLVVSSYTTVTVLL